MATSRTTLTTLDAAATTILGRESNASALFVMIVPGLLLVYLNLIPFLFRGREFRVEPAASISVRRHKRILATAGLRRFRRDRRRHDDLLHPFLARDTGHRSATWRRVFCRENGARLHPKVSGQLIGERLGRRGFTVARRRYQTRPLPCPSRRLRVAA